MPPDDLHPLPLSVTINNIEKRREVKKDYRRCSREATQLQSNLYYAVTQWEWQGDRSIHVDRLIQVL